MATKIQNAVLIDDGGADVLVVRRTAADAWICQPVAKGIGQAGDRLRFFTPAGAAKAIGQAYAVDNLAGLVERLASMPVESESEAARVG